ncbi:hypothetical protein D6C84_05807 [Aureobasidium pullulans]|uniref:Uncharacterized protein n=1 Tax=Aureobasidium pullulans TaxID=5580 RepID=A0A4S9XTY8_AURPU|nr:hypothetical protein D6C84_05807 [Aureobasidium pullulans]
MSVNTSPTHENVLEMFEFLTASTSLNPPCLETYNASSYELLERRQFTDMIQLVNHLLFVARMQHNDQFAAAVAGILESWVLRGDPMPNSFINESADLFATIGYRFRVMQWSVSQQAVQDMIAATRNLTLDDVDHPLELTMDGARIREDYHSFTPWAMTAYPGIFHDSSVPEQYVPTLNPYKTKIKPDHICIGFPCNFCTKVQKDFLAHESKHWEPQPCICAQLDQEIIGKELDKKICPQCGRLCIDENRRMIGNWKDAETGHLVRKFGKVDEMKTFANTTAIQMQRDVTVPDMGRHLDLNTKKWQ